MQSIAQKYSMKRMHKPKPKSVMISFLTLNLSAL